MHDLSYTRDAESRAITRRRLLRDGAACAAGILGLRAGSAWARPDRDHPYGPFRMGIQSYSLRGYSLDEALERTYKLGLRYWEAFQAHIPETDSVAQIKQTLDKLRAREIHCFAWGVQGFDGNEANARKTFEFAKAMGFRTITADPAPAALPILDKLVDHYRINIAIHNHGPGARYDKIASVANAIEGHHHRIGACVDTGHYLRSGEDPVEAVRRFGHRTYAVHLKDVKDRTTFVEVGRGDLDTVGLFRTLKNLKYEHLVSLEYEEHPENPIIEIDHCLAAARDAVQKAMAM